MGLRSEFYGDDDGGAGRLGCKGPIWNGLAKGDFVRGRVEDAAVREGRKMTGESARKVVLNLSGAVGQRTTLPDDGGPPSVGRFTTTADAPFVAVVCDGGRGGVVARALDEAGEVDRWIQIRHVGKAKKAEPGKSAAVHWEVKVWDREPAVGVAPLVVIDMSAERTARAELAAAPAGTVAL